MSSIQEMSSQILSINMILFNSRQVLHTLAIYNSKKFMLHSKIIMQYMQLTSLNIYEHVFSLKIGQLVTFMPNIVHYSLVNWFLILKKKYCFCFRGIHWLACSNVEEQELSNELNNGFYKDEIQIPRTK
jgi:hypothetical protein